MTLVLVWRGPGLPESRATIIGPPGPAGANIVPITVDIDGMGAPIAPGVKADRVAPFNGMIVGWVLLADQAGDIAIDVWRDEFAAFPPTSADSITGNTPPALDGEAKAKSSDLADWDTDVAEGDVLRFSVENAAQIERVSLVLFLQGEGGGAPTPTPTPTPGGGEFDFSDANQSGLLALLIEDF
jgi:hypothetical protein